MIDYFAGTNCFFLSQLIIDIWFFGPSCLVMIRSNWTHRKVSFTEQNRLKH